MLTEADWDGIEQVLRGCARVTVEECAYLKNAFVATERMWAENVAKVATVRLVMLSEAPQFGTEGRYFYNTATSFSSFFHFKDAEAILGHPLAKGRVGKPFLLPELARAGFIILDVFPFALNEEDTPSITYGGMPPSRYRELFRRTASIYFDKKRDLVLQLGRPHFLLRYKRLKDQLGDLIDVELAKRGIGRSALPRQEGLYYSADGLALRVGPSGRRRQVSGVQLGQASSLVGVRLVALRSPCYAQARGIQSLYARSTHASRPSLKLGADLKVVGFAFCDRPGLQGECRCTGAIRVQIATLTWQRTESVRRIKVTPLIRRCRASAGARTARPDEEVLFGPLKPAKC